MFKVGIVGLGYIGATHAQIFSDIDGVEVEAIADLSDACIEACAAKHAVGQTLSDYRELLALTDLDLVVVCLPNNLHAQVSIETLNAGHNVLCEKPMATSVKDAEAMIAAAEANQRMLAIVLNFRWQYFGPDAFHLRKLIEDGELGEIYYLRVQYLRRTSFPFGGYERWNLKQAVLLLKFGIRNGESLPVRILGQKKPHPFGVRLLLKINSGGVLLSRGQTPHNHRR